MKKAFLALLILMYSFAAFAQGIQVKGVVTSADDGQPIPGVSVVVKGTANGTITDVDGNYTISAQGSSTLIFSFVGMKSQEILVNNQSKINVVLATENTNIDEVVVVGYGVQKKSVVTAAISSVTSAQLANETPTRIEDVMKGRVSGVQITQSSGQPNSDSKVRIRGIGTVNSSDPLYIVDGMPVGGGINYLNPTDIQSIEILKDAASAAIYGARAANGVVLVTTKSGTSGKATVNYDFSYGWQNPWKKKSVLNAQEYMTIMNEMDVNDGNAPRYSADYIAGYQGAGTDWQDEVFNYNAPVEQHQLSINGGNDRSTYFLSAGYFKQEGIVGGNYGRSNYERYSVRSNSTYTVFEDKTRNFLNKLKAGANIGYSRDKSSSIETNSEYGSILGSAIAFSPLVPVYASDEDAAKILADHPTAISKNGKVFSLPPTGYQELANPVAQLNRPNGGKNNSDKFVASFYGELDILPGLKFRSSYGVDLAFWGYDGYWYQDYLSSMSHTDRSGVQSTMNRGFRWQVENYFSYNKTFAEKHNISVVLGQSANKYSTRNLTGYDYDLLDTDPSKANINYAIADRDDERVDGGTNGFNRETLASYFGRLDYNFAERYMVQATVRRDGSSHFGTNNKWGVFPSFSLGWNVWNEPYLKDFKPTWFNVLKLRFSWGQNGNESIGNFRYRSLMDGGENYYFGGSYDVVNKNNTGTMVYGTSPGAVANPDIKWETSTQTDIGVDMRLFDSRMNFGFDYFNKDTKDMLATMPVPVYIGQSAPMGNLGKMKNWGLEFETGWKDKYKDFSYNVGVTVSYLKNKLVSLGNASGETNYESAGASGVGDYVHAKNGEVWPYFYGYKTNGIFQNWEEVNSYVNKDGGLIQPKAAPGDVRFVDLDGNGSIGSADRTKIGKGMPDWTFGINLGAEWKGFDLSLSFQGTMGNDIFDFAQRGDIPAMNRPSWILDRWMGEGTSNKIPRMTSKNPNGNWASSDLYIHDGSYLRLKNTQFGYTLPANLTRKFSVQRLRFYIAAENLITITGYEGFDPELASGSYTTLGVDKGIYPQSRTISIGANITF
ncbi:MAG TPA: TonB-dependent receptor [Prolixibacteraceae bacterium]|nr:TonB-dependent receptor [Prolixibacteraceae bacterium]